MSHYTPHYEPDADFNKGLLITLDKILDELIERSTKKKKTSIKLCIRKWKIITDFDCLKHLASDIVLERWMDKWRSDVLVNVALSFIPDLMDEFIAVNVDELVQEKNNTYEARKAAKKMALQFIRSTMFSSAKVKSVMRKIVLLVQNLLPSSKNEKMPLKKLSFAVPFFFPYADPNLANEGMKFFAKELLFSKFLNTPRQEE